VTDPGSGFLDLLLRSVPILLGGGVVQFIVLMIKRRSEMRAADVAAQKTTVETDAVVVQSAERSLLLADQARDRADKRAERLVADLGHAEAELAEVHAEVRRLRIDVATLTREVAYLKSAGERAAHPKEGTP
jgi:hypothetical protein